MILERKLKEFKNRLALGSGMYYGRPLSYALAKTKEFGFEYIEITGPIHVNNLIYGSGSVDTIKEEIKRLDIKISSIHTYMSKGDSRVKDKSNYYKKLSDIAAKLGVKIIVDHICGNEYFKPKGKIISRLKELVDIFSDKDIVYTIENLLESPEEINEFLQFVPGLGVTLDIKHALSEGYSFEKYIKYFVDRIVNMHILGFHPSLELIFGDAQAPGADSFSWKEFAQLLRKYQYDRQLTVELFPQNITPIFLFLLLILQKTLKNKTEISIPQLTYFEGKERLPHALLDLDINKIKLVYDPKEGPADTSICDLLAIYTKEFCEKELLKG